MSLFFPSYKEWCQREDEWRQEVKWRLLNKKILTVDDMEVQSQLHEDDMAMSHKEDQVQITDMEPGLDLVGQESGEQAGLDASAAPDPGMDGGMDGGCSM